MKKSFFTKIKCAVRKWMSAKIIPNMVLNGWQKSNKRNLYTCQSEYFGWSNRCWCSMRRYRIMNIFQNEVTVL